ncbi:GNAT family N-acetyltransferase [Roseobacter ponti]|uniref:GNAT family N-acetyltransferase n=1 Tax=Roseobacter ponti TaxID=1891787 RepID=A0A858SWJ4_9RHOB|nr:GNAT family N-acetyltransferase [Roseobacter ponti]QJF52650.1 GNAT family N-acetyltransferase [Roseobacter ponti]
MTPRCTHIPTGLPAERAMAISAGVPELRTDRLRLRAARLADLPAWNELLVPDTAGHLGGPHDAEDAWNAFCVYVAGWALHGHGLWAVDQRDTGETLGFVHVGLEWGDAEPELGWMFLPGARGQGYATEAARAARDWAFDEGGLQTLVSYVHPDNTASAALARRLGAAPDAQNHYDLPGAIAFTHRPEALQ